MDKIQVFLSGALFGAIIMLVVMTFMAVDHRQALDGVGIKTIKHCHIDTPVAHSNWYEIVWQDVK